MATVVSSYSAISVFDPIAHGYEEAFDHMPAQVRSLQWFLTHLPPKSKVVDVGCGTGNPACSMLVNAGHDVLGIDLTPKMIDLARRRVPCAHFEVADGRTWKPADSGLKEGELDGVAAYFSFICGVSQAEIRDFFPRAFKWLKPGGSLVFGTVPVVGEHVEIKWLGRPAVVSSLSTEETVQASEMAGFVVEKVDTQGYTPKLVEGLCEEKDLWEEEHVFLHCRKPE